MDRVSLILSALVSGANAIVGDFATEELRPHFDYLSTMVEQSVEGSILDREPSLLIERYEQNRVEWRDTVGSTLIVSALIIQPKVIKAAKAIVANLPKQLVAFVRYPGDPEVPPPALPPIPSRPRKKRKMTSAR